MLAKTPARQRIIQDTSLRSLHSSKQRSPKHPKPFVIKDLPSPITIFNITYKGKSIIYPLYKDKEYLIDVLRPHIIKFERKHFGHGSVVVNWRTEDGNFILDYFLQKATCYDEFAGEIIRLVPIFRVPDSKHPRLKDYQLVKCIGTGGFSRVYLARKLNNGCFYAIKLMEKLFIYQNDRQLMIQSQRDIMSKLDHPCIVKLEEAFQTKHFFAFVIQYCPGGELFYLLKKIKRMTQDQAKFYFTEILLGINCLHQCNILYRDIKPENIMIDDKGHLKLTDFGLSKICDIREKSFSVVGSPEYMAPQMITETGHNYLLDYYCLGALLYQLLIGIPPFYTKDQEVLYSAILNEQLVITDDILLSFQVKDFLIRLLKKNPKQRIGATNGISELLEHPWMESIETKQILDKKYEPPFKPNLLTLNYDERDIVEDQKAVWEKYLSDPDEGNYKPPRQSWFQYRQKRNILKQIKELEIKPKMPKSYSKKRPSAPRHKPVYEPFDGHKSIASDKFNPRKKPFSPSKSPKSTKSPNPKKKSSSPKHTVISPKKGSAKRLKKVRQHRHF